MKFKDRHSKKPLEILMFRTVIRARHAMRHMTFFVKWIMLAIFTGTACGLTGTAFHYSLDAAAHIFRINRDFLYLLPLSGFIIVFLYRRLNIFNDEGTNSILRAARAEDTAALRVTPLIFTATFLTHVCGGSAGREGAALQIGGSLGSFISRKLNLSKYDHQLMVMCGMSATFCALFSTPLTAAFFSIEVAGVGTVFYAGLFPSMIASIIAMMISNRLGVEPMNFYIADAQTAEPVLFIKIIFLAFLTAILGIIFCSVMHNTKMFYAKFIKDPYLRIIAGAVAVIAITKLSGTFDYNGAGMSVITDALAGEAAPYAFILKLLLTALTLGAGFKGGEIVPTLFIGSTFGCTAGLLLGLDPAFASELCLVGLFCSVVNCPVSSILLSVELFGSENFIFFGITAAVTYLLSGYYSLYSGQKFMNSKLVPLPFEKSAK